MASREGLLVGGAFRHCFHDIVEVEAPGLLTWGELLEALQPLLDVAGRWCESIYVLDEPAVIVHADVTRKFEGVHAQIGQHGGPQLGEGFLPDLEAMGVLPKEGGFPIARSERGDASVVSPIDELLPRPLALALESGQQVVASAARTSP